MHKFSKYDINQIKISNFNIFVYLWTDLTGLWAPGLTHGCCCEGTTQFNTTGLSYLIIRRIV